MTILNPSADPLTTIGAFGSTTTPATLRALADAPPFDDAPESAKLLTFAAESVEKHDQFVSDLAAAVSTARNSKRFTAEGLRHELGVLADNYASRLNSLGAARFLASLEAHIEVKVRALGSGAANTLSMVERLLINEAVAGRVNVNEPLAIRDVVAEAIELGDSTIPSALLGVPRPLRLMGDDQHAELVELWEAAMSPDAAALIAGLRRAARAVRERFTEAARALAAQTGAPTDDIAALAGGEADDA